MRHLLEEPVGIFLIIVSLILIAPLFSRLMRLPGIVGLILSGVLIGPYGAGLLEREGAIELLGTVGLIYLMFSAGAEIDVHQFNRVRYRSLTFGFLTFIIPQTLGFLVGQLLGYSLLTSVLLGSIFASHTLLAFPIILQLGISRNEAISVTVGATIITDIGALLVLAAVAGVRQGDVSVGFFVQLFALFLGYAALVLMGVPRLGRFFFQRFSAGAVEFQFVLVVMFVAAFGAELIGMEAMVGAFLVGLAISSTLPPRSAVMGRVLFIGESFFVPVFLMSIGMLIDPLAFVKDGRTLLLSGVLMVTIFGTKYAASWGTAYFFGYTRDERMVMWGLSLAQAAATLAASLVGVQIGLFEPAVFNGVIAMILVTCVASPLIVERYGVNLNIPEENPLDKATPTFSRILVPVANPNTEDYLIQLGSILASSNDGILMPLSVARMTGSRIEGLEQQQRLFESEALHNPEVNIQPIRRVDTSIATGILSAAIEHEASTILMGWSGQASIQEALFGRMLDQVIWEAKVPVLVARLSSSINAKKRVVLVIPALSITKRLVKDTLQTADLIAKAINAPLLIMAPAYYMESVTQESATMKLNCQIEQLTLPVPKNVGSRVTTQDLVLLTSAGSRQRYETSLGSIPEELAARIAGSIVVIRYPL